MINILVPLAGKNTFKTNALNTFPKILSDVGGQLLIERAAKPFIDLALDTKIVVAIPKKESEEFRLNRVLPLLGDNITLCNINSQTQGAACSALLTIENIDLDSPLIITSFEQVLDFELTPLIKDFIDNKVDAGVLTFEAIHPKWSYVKVDEQQMVTQAAEKMPISRNAIAGLFYFKTARMFFDAAQAMIRKDVKTNNLFYIAPTLNEVILNGGRVKALPINKNHYYHINDDHSLENFEDNIISQKNSAKDIISKATMSILKCINQKDHSALVAFLADDVTFFGPNIEVSGFDKVSGLIKSALVNNDNFELISNNHFIADNNKSVVEFELLNKSSKQTGVVIIHWREKNKISKLTLYAYSV
ncbi:hypothetical protein F9L16_20215 [Agarivorans sp. B2Z047]|uniref:hypothetical protein n=1 Tax=Agarivorans sp. B2Z047 TaxID=2652721 RepID=UPI00128C3EEC|nr:hypothetical protein [Agarivorans sp. B2Z047]MPW31303.1 hypothetical protein [Agarivorans sp. B2Z047]UQN42733.1 hypothetical protein LQZ07_23655 [Agarivorans sp. B2Z047]